MLKIERRCHSHPSSEQSLRSCFAKRYSNYGIWQNQQLVGFYIAEQVLDEVSLHDLCVLPERQEAGLGKLLMQHFIQQAQQRGGCTAILEVRVSNQRAIDLYDQMGFVTAATRPNYYPTAGGREDALLMMCELGEPLAGCD